MEILTFQGLLLLVLVMLEPSTIKRVATLAAFQMEDGAVQEVVFELVSTTYRSLWQRSTSS